MKRINESKTIYIFTAAGRGRMQNLHMVAHKLHLNFQYISFGDIMLL